MPLATLDPGLDKLTKFESHSRPVVSLYLDLRPDQRGKDNDKPFLDAAFKEQLDRFDESGSDARSSLERDFEKIRRYVENDVSPSNTGARHLLLIRRSGAVRGPSARSPHRRTPAVRR